VSVARVYVASPYGFSVATKGFYGELFERIRAAGLEPIDPWKHRGVPAKLRAARQLPPGAGRREAFPAVKRCVGEDNAEKIEQADGVLAILDGVDVDSGTASEIGFAAALGKPIVGLRLDIRQTGDNEGAAINMQVEYFIDTSGGKVVRSIGRANALISRLIHGGSASG
jgi:nucleoside 2-deoxyribosyltransferase